MQQGAHAQAVMGVSVKNGLAVKNARLCGPPLEAATTTPIYTLCPPNSGARTTNPPGLRAGTALAP